MATTDVGICNMALTRCGASPITALDDENDKARLCLEYYEPTVQAELRVHPWNFAVKRRALAEDSSTPINEWDHQFQLPSDPYCISPLQVNEGSDEYVIEGRMLLTNATAVNLRYVARVNEADFDPLFVQALVLRLASKFMYRLTVSDASRSAILQELTQLALPDARFADSMEQREPLADQASESDWVASRFSQLS